MNETITKFVRIDDYDLGYEIHTSEQVIKILISNSPGCCDRWGFITTEDTLDDIIGGELLSLATIDSELKSHPLTVDRESFYEGGACFVDMLTSKGKLQFVLYNEHNGYYGHEIRIESNQFNHTDTL